MYRILLITSVFILLTVSGIYAQELEIHHINVGQGDCALIIGPDGTTMLIDAGDNGQGTAQVVPYLQNLGITQLNYMVATHMHADHIGGLDEVIESGIDVLNAIYDNGVNRTTQTFYDYENAAENTTAGGRTTITPNFVINLGNGAKATCIVVNGKIFDGSSVTVSDENDRSVGFLVEYEGFDYITAGDLGGGGGSYADVETPLAQALMNGLLGTEGVDVFHINHHGSPNSNNTNYVDLLNPEVGTISVGANSYGHPSKTSLNNCWAYDVVAVYQTAEGDIDNPVCSTDGLVAGDIIVSTTGVNNYTLSGNGSEFNGTITYELDTGSTPPPPVANLIISEMCDIKNNYLADRYIEIYNPTNASVSLTNWTLIAIQNTANGGTWNLSGTIAAGEALVCGKTGNSYADFTIEWSNSTWNGAATDGAKLLNNGTIVDYVYSTSTDYFKDAAYTKKATIGTPQTTYNSNEWSKLATTDINIANSTPGTHTCDYPDTPNFPEPTDLIATAGISMVDLTWNAPSESGFDAYKVYRSTTQGNNYIELATITNTNYNDNTVNNDITYYYVITAIYTNPDGESVYSNEANATPTAPSEPVVIISEMCDIKNNYLANRYIEIYNPTNSSIDLADWTLIAIQNGADGGTWNLSGTIAAGEALVCGKTGNSYADFTINWSNSTWNGTTTDGAKLLNNGTIIDYVYTTSRNYFKDAAYTRKSTIGTPSTTYNSGEWSKLSTSYINVGNSTPGRHTYSASYVINNMNTIAKLDQNYPNPFNPETIITYQLTNYIHTSLRIYNAKGQLVKTLVDDSQNAGEYNVVWNGKDNNNNNVATGMYIYRLEAGDYVETKRMLLIK